MTRGSCSSHLVVIYDLAKQAVISRNSWNQGDEVAREEGVRGSSESEGARESSGGARNGL